jgi:hypothetical protein
MAFGEQEKHSIISKTQGRCEYCDKKLSYENYGIRGAWGSWQIDHSKAKARGGQDHLNNLFPACVDCNSKKSDSSARRFREEMKPVRLDRRNDAIRRDVVSNSVPILSLVVLSVLSFLKWLRERDTSVADISDDRQTQIHGPRRSSIPWGAILFLGATVIIVILIVRSHKSP